VTIDRDIGYMREFIDFLQNGGRPPSWIHLTHIGIDPRSCAKFGWNRCSNFDNMTVLIFVRLPLKRLFMFPKYGFWGFDPQMGSIINYVLQRHILLEKHDRYAV